MFHEARKFDYHIKYILCLVYFSRLKITEESFSKCGESILFTRSSISLSIYPSIYLYIYIVVSQPWLKLLFKIASKNV